MSRERVVVEVFGKHWTLKDLKDLRWYLEEFEHRIQPSGEDYLQWKSIHLAITSTILREEILYGVER